MCRKSAVGGIRTRIEPMNDLAEYLVVLLDGPAVALEGRGEGHAQHHLPAPALKPARLPANRGRN